MIGIQDDHLRGTTGLTPGLDRPCGGIRPTHEAHRTGRGAAAVEQLLGRPDVRQVDARARAALEDRALLDIPVENRGHRVLDAEDEARRGLLRHAFDADVEPDRRVERSLLLHDEVLELVAENGRFGSVDEVAVLQAPRRDRVDDTVDNLAER